MEGMMTDRIKRDNALEPCPFCWGEASKIPDANHSTGWEVGCFSGKCDVEPHVWAVHLSTAVMQWNARSLPALTSNSVDDSKTANPVVNDPAAIPALQARIEELIEERDTWREIAHNEAGEAEHNFETMLELSAKLAKAVEWFKKLDRRGDALETFDPVVHEIVTAALAELEGETK